MTLIEVLLSLMVAGVGLGGILQTYILIAKRMDWALNSAAAQASALNVYERAMSATWTVGSITATNIVNELDPTNFPPQYVVLTVPNIGATPVNATNLVCITDTTTNPPYLKQIKVDCIWTTQKRMYTNTIMGYRAPNM